MTALQVVDGASKLEIEFAGGRKAGTEQLANWSRAGDWAVVVADTGSAPALERGEPERVAVGERLIVFAVEGDAKAIGGVDISGKRVVQGFGERIQFSPPIAIEAAGGPLLDLRGKVVGIVGGSVMPGARFDGHHMSVSPALGMAAKTLTAATPMFAMAGQTPAKVSALSELVAAGVLTAPLSDMDGLVYVTTSLEMNKGASDPLPREVSEFTRRDKQVWVTSEWQKKGKVSKGFLSAKVYDDQNRVRVNVEPKKMSLPSTLMRSSFGFSPGPLEAGDQLTPGGEGSACQVGFRCANGARWPAGVSRVSLVERRDAASGGDDGRGMAACEQWRIGGILAFAI